MKGFFVRRIVFILLALSFISPQTVSAQESCGSIIERTNGEEYSVPVEDCSNPFGVIVENENMRVSFGNTQIDKDAPYEFVGTTDTVTITGEHPDAFFVYSALYQHIPEGYLRINQNNQDQYTFAEAGTYTIVIYEEGEIILSQNWFKQLIQTFVPTAYAFPGPARAITFTVTEPDTEQKVSNILFIPGIQASRLYATDVNGEEERLWEPGGDDDVVRLRMTSDGQSVESIYAKEVIDDLGNVAIGGNIYKDFLKFLNNLDEDKQYQITAGVFPYDWRYGVFDVVDKGIRNTDGSYEDVTTVLEQLSETSITGKVTLIAHSNGGLVAKALMLKLEAEGKSNLIDKIIFIATPHIGTPKAIAALLHGFDQQNLSGLVSTDEAVRTVMKNMPGVYGLLPSEAYVEDLSEPLISFDDSSTTKKYRDRYGFTISNMEEYTDFLNGTEGREDAGNKINEISKSNGTMLDDALQDHAEKLDNWQAPNGVEVFNIVGTGLVTPKSIEYRSFKDMTCTVLGGCSQEVKIEPVLHFTNNGDETVVSNSAENNISSVVYIDFRSANRGIRNRNFEHSDMTESAITQSVVNYVLNSSSTEDIEFVSETEPTFSENTDILTIHSPARISIRDTGGNTTGRREVGGAWLSEIPGSSYLEVGGVKYVLVPSNLSYDIVIEGEGSGLFTHEVKVLDGDIEEKVHGFTASVTPQMVTRYSKKNNEYSAVTVDTNGDGIIDLKMTPDGTIIIEALTYSDLTKAIQALNIAKKYKHPLLELVTQAEKLSKQKKKLSRVAEKVLLHVLQGMVDKYKRAGIITNTERNNITKIINTLTK